MLWTTLHFSADGVSPHVSNHLATGAGQEKTILLYQHSDYIICKKTQNR